MLFLASVDRTYEDSNQPKLSLSISMLRMTMCPTRGSCKLIALYSCTSTSEIMIHFSTQSLVV